MRSRLVLVLLALVLVLGALPAPAPAEEVRSKDVYVRRRVTIAKTVRWLMLEASRLGVGQMLVVFDMASFAPPPGVTEFSGEYLFTDDLPAWLDALGNDVAMAECPVRVTSSLAPKSIPVGDPGWAQALRRLVQRPWWDGDAVGEVEPAWRWMNRLLQRTESGIGTVRGDSRRMLVLVTGNVTPERWTFVGNRPAWETEWRAKLLPLGEYWDQEAIAARLVADGCRFYAVAPEAHFGDFRPFVELPQTPWAARPQFPPQHRFAPGDTGPPVTAMPFDEETTRRLLDEALKKQFPDPAERRREVERALARMRKAQGGRGGLDRRRERAGGRDRPTTPGPSAIPPGGGPPRLHSSGWRFESHTPYWFPRYDDACFFNNHAPSGYGYWPFARVCAKTKGRYFFYPFPPSKWLDVCPRDGNLLDRLAPELIHETKYLSRRKGDRAHDAVARAANVVVGDTPWADGYWHQQSDSGWSSFRRVSPLAFNPDWSLRKKPFDDVFHKWQGTVDDFIRIGHDLQDNVLPKYDKALMILDEALAAEAAGNRRSHPRAVADLHLARYWFSMSAFHLAALGMYAVEVERFIPESMIGNVERLWVTYIPTIKMSDCLDAYDGRTLSLEGEAKYARWVIPHQRLQQGNILLIDAEDPDFRAKRSLASVLKHVDARLHRRAIDMIHSAKRVMRRYAMSGWGWSTYYSVAYTFVFQPVPFARGPRPSRGGDEPPPPPVTPSGPGTTPGGSGGGGPASGG